MRGLDIRISDCELYFCPIETRVPLKFGPETTTYVIEARAAIHVRSTGGAEAAGWGETPLSVAWVWPSTLAYSYRQNRLQDFCKILCELWRTNTDSGHSMEIGHRFIEGPLKAAWNKENERCREDEKMPWLAALVCNSLFDLALHDAYGNVHNVSTWKTFTRDYMNHDLSWYFGEEHGKPFVGKYPADYFAEGADAATSLVAWHLVGAKDILEPEGYDGPVVEDGYPFFLGDWIVQDGLTCLKVKLTGNDRDWDYTRLIDVGRIANEHGVLWLSADFNCTVEDPAYVCDILDQLLHEQPEIYAKLLYVEQPFPYDIIAHPIDVRSVSARKPLFMDESAHDWHHVVLGRDLGWSGVALKTCKTLSGALLSLCWAKVHGMTLMVQDLTNPMLAMIPHVSLAAYAGTIMGVEANAMQFYPMASIHEERIHPGLYARREGNVDFSTLGEHGFGYRYDEIEDARVQAKDEDPWVKA